MTNQSEKFYRMYAKTKNRRFRPFDMISGNFVNNLDDTPIRYEKFAKKQLIWFDNTNSEIIFELREVKLK